MAALVTAGYTVIAVNPVQAAEFRRRLGSRGAKSHALRDYFPAELDAFDDLDAADSLELPAKAPPGESRPVDEHADQRRAHTGSSPWHCAEGGRDPDRAARAASGPARGRGRRLRRLDPGADRGPDRAQHARVLGARVLAEFGDDPHRYASAKARKNYAHFPDHQGIRQEEGRPGPVHPPRPAHGRGCLKTGTRYDEATAWSHHAENVAA